MTSRAISPRATDRQRSDPRRRALPGTTDDTCITCGDVAVPLEVVEVDGGDALCRAADGGTERVAIDLVAPVVVGDHLLVHAGVAIERLTS